MKREKNIDLSGPLLHPEESPGAARGGPPAQVHRGQLQVDARLDWQGLSDGQRARGVLRDGAAQDAVPGENKKKPKSSKKTNLILVQNAKVAKNWGKKHYIALLVCFCNFVDIFLGALVWINNVSIIKKSKNGTFD